MNEIAIMRDYGRMCNSASTCDGCELHKLFKVDETCAEFVLNNPKKTIETVKQWAETNPIKTQQSEFLKMFPNANIEEDTGILNFFPCDMEDKEEFRDTNCNKSGGYCTKCREWYWLEEIE